MLCLWLSSSVLTLRVSFQRLNSFSFVSQTIDDCDASDCFDEMKWWIEEETEWYGLKGNEIVFPFRKRGERERERNRFRRQRKTEGNDPFIAGKSRRGYNLLWKKEAWKIERLRVEQNRQFHSLSLSIAVFAQENEKDVHPNDSCMTV